MAFLSRVNVHRSHKQRKCLQHHQAFVEVFFFFFVSPGKNGSIYFPGWLNVGYFFAGKKGEKETFLAGEMPFW